MEDNVAIIPLLSILMPTIPERSRSFQLLRASVESQIKDIGAEAYIEVLVDDTKRFLEGGKSIGQKRDDLVQSANGMYCCFLDDDDEIFPNYVRELFYACKGGLDSYTFKQLYRCDKYSAVVEMSFDNKVNEQVAPNGVIKRTIWHTCAIRTDIAKTERFSGKNYDEDWDWLKRIIPKINTSEHINMILHQYNDIKGGSEATKIINNGHK